VTRARTSASQLEGESLLATGHRPAMVGGKGVEGDRFWPVLREGPLSGSSEITFSGDPDSLVRDGFRDGELPLRVQVSRSLVWRECLLPVPSGVAWLCVKVLSRAPSQSLGSLPSLCSTVMAETPHRAVGGLEEALGVSLRCSLSSPHWPPGDAALRDRLQ
jgi:hypothetical protein